MSRWEFFDPHVDTKLVCSCGCGQMRMDDDFMQLMVQIRKAVSQALIVRSGYRCPTYNMKVSKTGATGPHTWGRAIDVAATGRLRYLVQEEAKARGCTRFGMGPDFIHVDNLTVDEGFTERVVWTY